MLIKDVESLVSYIKRTDKQVEVLELEYYTVVKVERKGVIISIQISSTEIDLDILYQGISFRLSSIPGYMSFDYYDEIVKATTGGGGTIDIDFTKIRL